MTDSKDKRNAITPKEAYKPREFNYLISGYITAMGQNQPFSRMLRNEGPVKQSNLESFMNTLAAKMNVVTQAICIMNVVLIEVKDHHEAECTPSE